MDQGESDLPSENAGAGTAPAGREERLTKIVARTTAIVGLFVTFNTIFTGCSANRIDHANAYRTVLQTEEKYWSDLQKEFLKTSSSTTLDEQQKTAAMLMIAYQSRRIVPKFEEYRTWWLLDPPGHEDAWANLNRVQRDLHRSLGGFAQNNPELREDLALFVADLNQSQDRDATDVSTTEPPPVTEDQKAETEALAFAQTAAPEPEKIEDRKAVFGTKIVTAGDQSGWDIDVFWCSGEGRDRNYSMAFGLTSALAQNVEDGQPFSPNYKIGRVRLRSLSEAAQASGRFAVSGDNVIRDSAENEQAAGEALKNYLDALQSQKLGLGLSGGKQTPWYLSVFICKNESN